MNIKEKMKTWPWPGAESNLGAEGSREWEKEDQKEICMPDPFVQVSTQTEMLSTVIVSWFPL